MSLKEYRRKRQFDKTPEPKGQTGHSAAPGRIFVVQKHAARRLHYDFRLEYDGVLKSWAVPNGPNLDPSVKSLAVHVEDHPLDYANFEGTIPKGEYGGGTVMVWDRGTWESHDTNVADALERGKISFRLHGEKLSGDWTLVRMRGRGDDNWLLIKRPDDFARSGRSAEDILSTQSRSVLTGRDLSQIADGEKPIRKSQRPPKKKAASDKTAATDGPIMAPATVAAHLKAAPSSKIPANFRPQLATLADRVPEGQQWLHEIKLDGYRVLAHVDGKNVMLLTRSGLDWTERFPTIADALRRMQLRHCLLDGEIVAEDERGASNFQLLQNSLANDRDQSLVYYVFDLPWAEGKQLTDLPLVERKQVLEQLLDKGHRHALKKPGAASRRTTTGHVRYHDHILGAGQKVLSGACNLKLEGIVSKRIDSPYASQRTATWLKVKCARVQEFVIAGYTRPAGKRHGFGALLLGYYRGDDLVYCGRVGTGFTQTSLRELSRRFAALKVDESPYTHGPKGAQLRGVQWLRPVLVAEISYATRTAEGILRQSVFHGLREDKPADQVKLEKEHAVPRQRSSSRSSNGSEDGAVAVSHPERIVYEQPHLTKADVVQYLTDIAPWMLPELAGRPLTLLRCPQGTGGHCFYQKNFDEQLPDGIDSVTIREEKETTTYAVVRDARGLAALAQLNTIEFHPWPALAKDVERPDRLVFDLDPGEGAAWSSVVQGARDVRDTLKEVGLESFLRTSGGKGLHVVVPLRAGSCNWEQLKEFAKLLAQTLAAQHPDRYVATISKAARRGKVLIDYLRNQRGATAVASYSPRARTGAGVAMPVRWRDLSNDLTSNKYTIVNAVQHARRRRSDPWPGFFELEQGLPAVGT